MQNGCFSLDAAETISKPLQNPNSIEDLTEPENSDSITTLNPDTVCNTLKLETCQNSSRFIHDGPLIFGKINILPDSRFEQSPVISWIRMCSVEARTARSSSVTFPITQYGVRRVIRNIPIQDMDVEIPIHVHLPQLIYCLSGQIGEVIKCIREEGIIVACFLHVGIPMR